MNSDTLERFAAMNLEDLKDILQTVTLTQAVDQLATDLGRFVNVKPHNAYYNGGEDMEYTVKWDRAMFLDYEHFIEPRHDYERWIRYVDGVDPYDDPPEPQYKSSLDAAAENGDDEDPFEKYYDGSSMEGGCQWG